MNEKFGRITEFIVGGQTLRTPDLEIQFQVNFDNDTEPNESKVIIYNLSEDTIETILAKKKAVLNAGYKSSYGTILSGYITRHETEFQEVDKKTTFYILDSTTPGTNALKTVSYGKNTKTDTVLRDLARRGGLSVAQMNLPKNVNYPRGTTASGTVISAIKKFSKDAGASAYIRQGKLYVRPGATGDSSGVIISSESGMIGSPSVINDEKLKGYDVKVSLEHRITTNSLVVVQSKYVNATLRVHSGKHVSDGASFITEMEAIY